MVGLRDLARAFPEVRFYAISRDTPQDSRDLEKKIEADHKGAIGFSMLSDPESKTIDRYGLRDPAYAREKLNGVPKPTVIVLDRDGKIRWLKIEEDYRERPTNDEVGAALDAFE